MNYSFLSVAIVICVAASSVSMTAATATATAPVSAPPADDRQLRRHRGRLATTNTATAMEQRGLWWDDDWWNLDLGWDDDWWNIDLDWDEIVSNLQDIDWDSIDWGTVGGWAQFFADWTGVLPDDFGVCSVVETALGMSGQFAEDANCECVGDVFSGMEIDCSFRGCAYESTEDETCGTVQLVFGFGGNNDGRVDVSACADMEDDWLDEICFGYGIDVTNGFDFDPASQTCEASYGGQTCGCAIDESFCLSLDCSSIMPFAKTDTCQLLSFDEGVSVNAFVPEFAAFRTDISEDEDNDEDGEDGEDENPACADVEKFIWKEKEGETIHKKCAKWVAKKLQENEKFCNKKTSEGIKIGEHCPETCGLC